jgi:uncharacterized LabA/DUF88 family protein
VDKAIVFVDAGYLLAASAELLTGSKKRSAIEVSYQPLVAALIGMAEHHCRLDMLRVYWYDGARRGIPTQDQLVLAHLPHVKLRLGRRTAYGQKGVDSLIVLDITSLAREKAMSTAYLVSGDEDIREGVAVAQQAGVRVVLLGIPTRSGRSNQADTLIREADEHIVLERGALIDPHIRPVAPPPAPPAAASAGAPPLITPRQVGRQFGEAWLTRATDAEANALRAQVPKIPRELDAELFREAEQTLGALRGREPERKELRAGFWDAIMSRRNNPDQSTKPHV